MAAKETELGSLHAILAKALADALQGQEVPDYEDPETGDIVPGGSIPPSASIMTVAAKFLKDNNITCEASDDNEMGELQRIMEDRQKRLRGLDQSDRAGIIDASQRFLEQG